MSRKYTFTVKEGNGPNTAWIQAEPAEARKVLHIMLRNKSVENAKEIASMLNDTVVDIEIEDI
jgi:hypothetical protein